jgi:hypothetical protein
MSLTVVEQIAVVIKTRLATLETAGTETTTVSEVVRPLRIGGYRPQDWQIVLNQESTIEIDELSYPGNPPAICHETTWNIRCRTMPSERDDTPKDTLANQFVGDVRKVIRSANDWYSFGGKAVDARFGDYELVEGESGGTGVKVPLIVQYRFSEDDPTEVRA